MRPEVKQRWRSRRGQIEMRTKRRSKPARAGGVKPRWVMVRAITTRAGAVKSRSGMREQRPSIKASERDFTESAFLRKCSAVEREMKSFVPRPERK